MASKHAKLKSGVIEIFHQHQEQILTVATEQLRLCVQRKFGRSCNKLKIC